MSSKYYWLFGLDVLFFFSPVFLFSELRPGFWSALVTYYLVYLSMKFSFSLFVCAEFSIGLVAAVVADKANGVRVEPAAAAAAARL